MHQRQQHHYADENPNEGDMLRGERMQFARDDGSQGIEECCPAPASNTPVVSPLRVAGVSSLDSRITLGRQRPAVTIPISRR